MHYYYQKKAGQKYQKKNSNTNFNKLYHYLYFSKSSNFHDLKIPGLLKRERKREILIVFCTVDSSEQNTDLFLHNFFSFPGKT